MKLFFQWSLILISYSSFSQSTIVLENRLNKVEETIKSNDEIIQTILNKNDSLERELLYYRVKEDYFAAALGEQATRFGVIIGAIVGLLALFSFSWYRVEKRKINKEFKLFTEQFTQIKKENEKLEDDLNILTANAGVMFADQFHELKSYEQAFMTNLTTVTSLLNIKGTMKDKTHDAIIAALTRCVKDLSELKKVSDPLKEFKEWEEDFYKELDEINIKGNEKMKTFAAQIRLLLTSIFEKNKRASS